MNYTQLLVTLLQKSNNTHYAIRYLKFVTECNERNVGLSIYTEKHHILPKAKHFWPEYKSFSECPWNKATLTAREHIIAHHMLAKCIGGSMWTALWHMVNEPNEFHKGYNDVKCRSIMSRLYEEVRINNAEQQSLRKSAWWTDERKQNQSDVMTERYRDETKRKETGEKRRSFISRNKDLVSGVNAPRYGIPLSDESKTKLVNSLKEYHKNNPSKLKGEKNPMFGKTTSEETKQKIRESQLKTHKECKHCLKVCNPGVFARLHGDKCKMRRV